MVSGIANTNTLNANKLVDLSPWSLWIHVPFLNTFSFLNFVIFASRVLFSVSTDFLFAFLMVWSHPFNHRPMTPISDWSAIWYKNTMWVDSGLIVSSKDRIDQQIGSGITPVFGEDGCTATFYLILITCLDTVKWFQWILCNISNSIHQVFLSNSKLAICLHSINNIHYLFENG